jgi:hypothetical protein
MKPDTTIYRGRRMSNEGRIDTVSGVQVLVGDQVTRGEHELDIEPSLKLRNHSPTGYNWSYGGSGPAQLALALLLHFTESDDVALRQYQNFKFEFVAGWGDEWQITGEEIRVWLDSRGVAFCSMCRKPITSIPPDIYTDSIGRPCHKECGGTAGE